MSKRGEGGRWTRCVDCGLWTVDEEVKKMEKETWLGLEIGQLFR
jgi:hypothetical protein